MTSPAQLKYLEAIGIPVWVSRARVRVALEKTNLPSEEPSSQSGSMKDILSGLEDTLDKPIRRYFNPEVPRQKPSSEHANDRTVNSKETQLDKLFNEIGRTEQYLVFASGNLDAEWLIIGESPELNEPHQSQPYTADSGILIDQMLKSVGLENPRTDAHIINVIKHSFVSNSSDSSELNKMLTTLIEQVSPKVVVIVGQLSAQNLLQTKEPLARLRSKPHQIPVINIPAIVTYYPTYLLSKPLDKRKTWEDLKLAMSIVKSDIE